MIVKKLKLRTAASIFLTNNKKCLLTLIIFFEKFPESSLACLCLQYDLLLTEIILSQLLELSSVTFNFEKNALYEYVNFTSFFVARPLSGPPKIQAGQIEKLTKFWFQTDRRTDAFNMLWAFLVKN